MRRIKYRIWDKENEKFYEEDYRAYEGEVEDMFIDPSGELHMRKMTMGTTKYIHESLFPDRFEVSQYTGLTDRNGTPIYEGDILRIPDLYETPENTATRYHNEAVTFEDAAFCSGGNPLCDDREYISDESEVIGNIYEHAHLLKGE